jgi:hypothetical protein
LSSAIKLRKESKGFIDGKKMADFALGAFLENYGELAAQLLAQARPGIF